MGMDITENTRRFLNAAAWTQEQLAQAIGVHPVSLNRYLNRRKRIGTGERLAAFLASEAATQALAEIRCPTNQFGHHVTSNKEEASAT